MYYIHYINIIKPHKFVITLGPMRNKLSVHWRNIAPATRNHIDLYEPDICWQERLIALKLTSNETCENHSVLENKSL